ncbi:hypothetical protein BGX28_008778 [Mortierella sp. GBA30]|nr:hypothetical protein BGX28_008778 [Mortierella sp. GBA30]
MSSRHRALLGSLLIFCIGSLLALSLHSLSSSSNAGWMGTRRAGLSTSSSSPSSLPLPSMSEKIGTGTGGADLENNSDFDSTGSDYMAMSVDSLRRLIRGTILDTGEDLMDPTRPIRLEDSGVISKLFKPENMHISSEDDEGDQVGAGGVEEEEEDKNEKDPIADDPIIGKNNGRTNAASLDDDPQAINKKDPADSFSDPTMKTNEPQDLNQDTEKDKGSVESDQQGREDNSNDQASKEEQSHESGASKTDAVGKGALDRGTLLADFDVNKVLSPLDSYLVFIPSGETVEAQFFSLLTSLWIAKHSNRTLIIPPPMMSSPSLDHLYPVFAGSKGRKRQRWSTLFDLRTVSNTQRTVLIDNTRPVLQIPFTRELAFEEEDPTSDNQSVPYMPPAVTGGSTAAPASTTVPVKINCYGPPTAGSWKALDFAGRHFLNRYNLLADFEVVGDPYWNMKPDMIQRHWQASARTESHAESQGDRYEAGRHKQLICISGANLVGSGSPVMEEMIWQDIGLQIPFSNGVKQQGLQNIVQVLRALERTERRNGYIGVHIDKLPSKEFCRRVGSHSSLVATERAHALPSLEPLVPLSTTQRPSTDVQVAVAGIQTRQASVITPSQCHWTVDLIAKRIAILQQTEGDIPRPVIITTTETDPELLAKMDRQQGWLRIGTEDEGTGLFDIVDDELGGYGQEVTRAFVMANSAIFVGSRLSALGVHAAFRIKNEGRTKQIPPRWELY